MGVIKGLEPGVDYAYLIIKPHAVEGSIHIEILQTLTDVFPTATVCFAYDPKDLSTRKMIEEEYSEHKDKDFFGPLVESMLEGQGFIVRVFALENQKPAVRTLRQLEGHSDPSKAEPGTLRAKFGRKEGPIRYNAVHAPDSIKANEEFEKRWFHQK